MGAVPGRSCKCTGTGSMSHLDHHVDEATCLLSQLCTSWVIDLTTFCCGCRCGRGRHAVALAPSSLAGWSRGASPARCSCCLSSLATLQVFIYACPLQPPFPSGVLHESARWPSCMCHCMPASKHLSTQECVCDRHVCTGMSTTCSTDLQGMAVSGKIQVISSD